MRHVSDFLIQMQFIKHKLNELTHFPRMLHIMQFSALQLEPEEVVNYQYIWIWK